MLLFGLALLIGGVAVLYRYRVEIAQLLLWPLIPPRWRRPLARLWARVRQLLARLRPYLEPLRPWHERLRSLQRRWAPLWSFPRRSGGSWLRRPPWPWRSARRQSGAASPGRPAGHATDQPAPVTSRVRRPLVPGRGSTAGRSAAGRATGRRVYRPRRPDRSSDGTAVRWVPGRAAVPGHSMPPQVGPQPASPERGRAIPPEPRHRRGE